MTCELYLQWLAMAGLKSALALQALMQGTSSSMGPART